MTEKIKITKDTMLSDLLISYPWLKEKLPTISDKFKMLNTPMANIMLKKASIAEMSRRSGVDINTLIEKMNDLINSHQ